MRIFFLLLAFPVFLGANEINFIKNDVHTAQGRAAKEEKLILVKFTAKYCAPCEVMEQSTWKDSDVQQYVEKNCVPASIDIENLDGQTYKQHFNVSKLPTLLLLNACGRELARFENYVSAKRLVQWLAMFNSVENRKCGYGLTEALPEPFLKNQVFVETQDILKPNLANVEEAFSPSSVPSANTAKLFNEPAISTENRTDFVGPRNEIAVSPMQKPTTNTGEKFYVFPDNWESEAQLMEAVQHSNVISTHNEPLPSPKKEKHHIPKPVVREKPLNKVQKPSENAFLLPPVERQKEMPVTKPLMNSLVAAEEESILDKYSQVVPPENPEINYHEALDPIPSTPAPMENPKEEEAEFATAPSVVNSNRLVWISAKKGYSVQIFATRSKETAESMREKCVADYPYPVAVLPVGFVADDFYRVMVGVFGEKSEADFLHKQILNDFKDAFVREIK